MSKDKKTWVEFRKKIEDDINWAGLKEQLDDSGKKKDTHFDKLRKVKDQINKQKEKIGKIDISDPKQRTPHAIARADLKSMNLKLKDMQVTDNEPETDDKGKPSKKKYIKELEERSLVDLKARRAKVKQTLDRVSKEKGSTVGINDPEYKELKHLDTLIKNYSEEFELNEYSSKIPYLIGKVKAHMEMYKEMIDRVLKLQYGKKFTDTMLTITAQTASKSVPAVIKELDAPNLWREQVEKAVKAVQFWEAKQNVEEAQQPGFAVRYLDPKNGKRFTVAYKTKKDADDKAASLKSMGAKDISITKHDLNFKAEELDETAYTDWLKNTHSKELRQLGVQDIKKYADLWTTHKQKQFQTLRVNKGSRQTPIAAELEPDTIKKEDVVREVSPPGWEGTVRAMKKHPELGGEKGDKNIYALSWYLKNKGAKSHYKDKGGKPVKKDKYKSEEKIKVNEGYDEDVRFGISGLETDRQTIEEEKQMDKKYFKTKIGSVEDNINKIRVEQPTVKIEKRKVTLQAKSYFDQKKGSLADTAAKVVSEEVIKEAVDFKVLVKKAVAIAKKMTGNYSGATREIEKIAKNLSNDPDVRDALKTANEEIKTEARSPEEQKKQDKMMKDFLAKGGKVKKLKPGIAKGAGHLDLRGPYKKDMLAASAVYKAPTTKYKKTTLAAQKSFKDLRSETDQKEVEKDLVATKVGGKGKTLTGKKPAVIDTEPKVNPI